MSDETTLLPCYHCGCDTPWLEDIEHTQGLRWYVFCPVCGATGGQKRTRAEAIAAWNTRAEHGILTAEQVREAIEHHGTASLGCRWQFTDRNLQAIADELNKLGSGACEVESEFWHDHGGDESDTYEFVLSCGHSVEWLDSEPPRHCPDCGRKVKR